MALSLSHLTNKWYVEVVGGKNVCFWYMSARLLNSKVSSRDEGGGVGELIASDPSRTGLYKLLQVYSLTHSVDRSINQSIKYSLLSHGAWTRPRTYRPHKLPREQEEVVASKW